ncbi:MAG: T9SS type A sorting domain-containing protein [Crocinitomicaceae bacterium]|nr:T9SS type A sorting domain-containing protein [Crocinitomicaceae bacterium]MDP4723515.1 T9SS type A sorting domain-containing protein [Crocinitomicaceae bacterium]MDP4740075.1 T9SS type A sorting domain-containing protein [Crocinitomicaceae bacterium]MDP4799904.1 T9SS type A sorting domain-containing protein [Crocinitomicaceae bacterium]MDP4805637.1 T9SS type A sorting domain-containing protein [Crocinitomicaceae bacterium]
MKAHLLSVILLTTTLHAQQIGNAGFENWDNLGSNQEEPTNWSSFKTATGSFATFASKQVERSTNVRTGATGSYCARIWSKSTLGIVANGVVTTGRMNMGSSNLSSPDNYNYTVLNDAAFSEALTLAPDSIVFWARYTAAAAQKAGMHAVIHDQFSVQDPINAASEPFVVADADFQFSPTNNNWVRFSVPFNYTVNTGLAPQFILLTFTTNHIPGGGSANDEVLIDDVELIYNLVGIQAQNEHQGLLISIDENKLVLIEGSSPQEEVEIYKLSGQLLQQTTVSQINGTALPSGFYIIRCAGTGAKIYVP